SRPAGTANAAIRRSMLRNSRRVRWLSWGDRRQRQLIFQPALHRLRPSRQALGRGNIWDPGFRTMFFRTLRSLLDRSTDYPNGVCLSVLDGNGTGPGIGLGLAARFLRILNLELHCAEPLPK